jgi:hypothetical protein
MSGILQEAQGRLLALGGRFQLENLDDIESAQQKRMVFGDLDTSKFRVDYKDWRIKHTQKAIVDI